MAWDQTDGEPTASTEPLLGAEARPWPDPLALATAEPRRRRVVWLVGLGAVVCLLAGVIAVTTSSHKASATKLVLGAPERNAAAGTAHFTADLTLTKGGNPLTAIQMNGDEDASARVASITMGAGPTTAEIRLIDGIEYFSSSLAKLPAGKSWVKIDPAAVGIQTSAMSPVTWPSMAQLALLGGLVGGPIATGTDTIDGVAVTRYDVTLDFTKIFGKISTAASALDDQGRARAFSFGLHIVGPNGTIDESIDMRFTDFGKSVTVELPPADQIVPFGDVPDVFKNLTGG